MERPGNVANANCMQTKKIYSILKSQLETIVSEVLTLRVLIVKTNPWWRQLAVTTTLLEAKVF